MLVDLATIDPLHQGDVFGQVYFLDNFYENVSIEDTSSADLAKFLTTLNYYSTSLYVKRLSFKILSELTIAHKITNKHYVLSILFDFLASKESSLVTIALKFLPRFNMLKSEVEERLIALTDDNDAQIASEAYLSLGIRKLHSIEQDVDNASLVIELVEARSYFTASNHSIENRVDADFYLLLIDLILSILSNNPEIVKAKFLALENNISFRHIYNLGETGLELEFLIFQLTQRISIAYETSRKSKEWFDFHAQVQILVTLNLEIEEVRNAAPTNVLLKGMLFENTLKTIENSIYNIYLSSEKTRFVYLRSASNNENLKKFLERIISLTPDVLEHQSENLEMLSLLSSNLGSEEGLIMYNRIRNKEINLANAIEALFRKNLQNQLPFRTGSIIGQDVLNLLMVQIDENLPNYNPEKRNVFFKIIEEVIRYTRVTFLGNDKSRFHFLFSEKEGGKGQTAIEQDLQDSMLSFFEHSNIADGLEHEKTKFVDGGRVDIVYKRDLITIPIELKKSLNRPNKKELEDFYISQAQTYTSGYDQLGIFVLLELSDKSKEAPPNFKDWFKVHHLDPSTNQQINYPDFVISVIIPGNRSLASSKSTYK